MVTTQHWKIPLEVRMKARRHLISFVVICAVLPFFMINGINVLVWCAMCALLLPVYGLFIFKILPHILVTGRKVSRAIVNGFFAVMAISLVMAMGGWELSMYLTLGLYYIILPLFFLLTVATSVEVHFLNSQHGQPQQIEIEREQAMTERSFLKAQINPHFLFNTLNNIFAMVKAKSDAAADAVLLLASLMRRTVSMSMVEKIPLLEEIQYLGNYIDLQRIQRIDQDELQIEFKVPQQPTHLFIEPLILIAFVENAFKHGVITGMRSFVSVIILVEADRLILHVSNTKFRFLNQYSNNLSHANSTGMGLVNARRRLEIGYPQKHKLRISDGHGQYVVRLEIEL